MTASVRLIPKRSARLSKKNADLGLAFDGDGDRLIAVDEKGNIVDGDQIMYICSKHLKSEGRLKDDTLVSTVMSNLGFYKALEKEGIKSVQTAVGDRYVVEAMKKTATTSAESSQDILFSLITTRQGTDYCLLLC